MEKTPLLQNADEDKRISRRHGYKFFLLMIVTTTMFISVGVMFYLMNQWIQYTVQNNVFGENTFNTTSPCKDTNHSTPDYVKYKEVEEKTATWQMYNNVAVPIPGLLATLILPSYSDMLGRKFLFLVSLTALTLKCLMFTLIMYFEWGVIWMVVTSFIEGFSGSVYTFTSGAFSYIADITAPGRQRTLGITVLEGVMLICMTLSGLGGGYLIEFEGFVVPMAGCTICLVVAWITAILFLPETHEKENRAQKASPCGIVKRMTIFYTSNSFLGKRSSYFVLLLTYFFTELTNSHRSSIEILYQLGQPFCWPSEKIGLFSAARHATQGLAGAVLIAPLKACFSDVSIAALSAVFNIGSYILEAFAQTDLILYLVPIPATFSFLTVPVVKSMMSSMTDIDKQGSLFASVVVVQSVSSIVASFLFNSIYVSTVSLFNGFVFLVLAGLSGVVLLLLVLFAFIRRGKVLSSSVTETLVTNG